MNIKQGLVFALMVQQDGGIMEFAPQDILLAIDQVEDKYFGDDPDRVLLNDEGQRLFNEWKEKYKVHF